MGRNLREWQTRVKSFHLLPSSNPCLLLRLSICISNIFSVLSLSWLSFTIHKVKDFNLPTIFLCSEKCGWFFRGFNRYYFHTILFIDFVCNSSFIFHISSVSSLFTCFISFHFFFIFHLFPHFPPVSLLSICFLIFHLFLRCLSVSSYYICSYIFHLFHHFPPVSLLSICFLILYLLLHSICFTSFHLFLHSSSISSFSICFHWVPIRPQATSVCSSETSRAD